MALRFSKRGKNSGVIDNWLDTLGYYRKNVAYDETCLFRAVSEQLFNSQIYHENVRRKSVEYGETHMEEFINSFSGHRELKEHLNKLSKHMVVSSDVEITLISRTYNIVIELYNASDYNIEEYKGDYNSSKTVRLCKVGDDHYDAVYDKEIIAIAGFCQSIAYGVLYENVFKIDNVQSIVNSMLHDKTASMVNSPDHSTSREDLSSDETSYEDHLSNRAASNAILSPFPFKIAKALDPNMYRNIEYDVWLEVRRELQLGEWYYGDDKLIQGTRCLINFKGENLHCYIQEILHDDECIVYITKFAERLTVKYTDLKRENDAKPWPLPYRFSRNTIAPVTAPPENDRNKSLRKRRERRRSQITNESNNETRPCDKVNLDINLNINKYEGYPLLMKNSNNGIADKVLHPSVQNENDNNNTQSVVCLPESNSSAWNETSNTSSQLSWQQDSTNVQNDYSQFVDKMTTVVSSPWPEAVNNQPSYNYNNECTWSVPTNVWQTSQYSLPSGSSPQVNGNEVPSLQEQCSIQNQKYMYYHADNSYCPSTYLPPMPLTPLPSSSEVSISGGERVVCSAPITPISPRIDVFPFMYPVQQPTTPIYYTNLPPPPPMSSTANRPPEYFIPAAPSPVPPIYNHVAPSPIPTVYSPTVELQYSTPPTYVYPTPTSPAAWYSPNVNQQGFIFPPPLNNANVPNYT